MRATIYTSKRISQMEDEFEKSRYMDDRHLIDDDWNDYGTSGYSKSYKEPMIYDEY